MNLHTETLKLLKADPRTLDEISKAAGVNRHWLEKFRQEKYPNPGVNHVQKLYDFYTKKRRGKAA